jgi:predicted chitinase
MKKVSLIFAVLFMAVIASGQNFEQPKVAKDFDGVKVKVGGDFAIQLQSLDHEASVELVELNHNFNLPTANLSLTAKLAPGIQLYMNNYLSSRHHNEAWVEGGYLTIDQLPFLPAANSIMEYLTIKAGVMNPNYGDAHFYRSNNAAVLNNPFVGNWIMDNFTTNPGIEFMYRNKGFLALVGTNNGRMNYGRGNDIGEDLVFNWKLAYDTDINEDLRIRASFSGYHVGEGHSGSYLWDGDRAGARYYNVMQTADAEGDNFRSGRWSPGSGQSEMNSYMANLFVKFHGLEVFGIYENMKGVKRDEDQHYTQTALQAIYRIGSFYVGTRLNKVSDNEDSKVTRTNIGGGWYMTNNVLVKLDYVNQEYEGPAHGAIDGGNFNGLVLEAAISF